MFSQYPNMKMNHILPPPGQFLSPFLATILNYIKFSAYKKASQQLLTQKYTLYRQPRQTIMEMCASEWSSEPDVFKDGCRMSTAPNKRGRHLRRPNMRSFGVTLLVVLIPSATALREARHRSLKKETSNIFLSFLDSNVANSDMEKKKQKSQKKVQKSKPDVAESINESTLIIESELPTMSPTECDDGPGCPTSPIDTESIDPECDDGPGCPTSSLSLASNSTPSPRGTGTIDPECDDGPDCPTASSQSLVHNSSLIVSADQQVNTNSSLIVAADQQVNVVSMMEVGNTEKDEFIKVTMGVKDASSSNGWGASSLFAVGIVFVVAFIIK
jgi:hypothetical protein